MKNLKVILSSVSALAIAILIYFTSVGLTNEIPVIKEKNESVSASCTFYVHLNSTSIGCIDGDYKYCINGGPSMHTSSDVIVVEVPCERLYTLCVESGSGCRGSIQLPAACPCPLSGTHVTLYIESWNPACDCD